MPNLTPQTNQASVPELAGGRSIAVQASESVQSTDLFKGQKSILIEHNGHNYRLQMTRQGKLILTK
jgi:hemin uptake protein HemP